MSLKGKSIEIIKKIEMWNGEIYKEGVKGKILRDPKARNIAVRVEGSSFPRIYFNYPTQFSMHFKIVEDKEEEIECSKGS